MRKKEGREPKAQSEPWLGLKIDFKWRNDILNFWDNRPSFYPPLYTFACRHLMITIIRGTKKIEFCFYMDDVMKWKKPHWIGNIKISCPIVRHGYRALLVHAWSELICSTIFSLNIELLKKRVGILELSWACMGGQSKTYRKPWKLNDDEALSRKVPFLPFKEFSEHLSSRREELPGMAGKGLVHQW